ncbi:hypothetical protein U2I83_19455 [Bacillus amyloliquefaciens]|uniref:hypothetical protein n=1 Tax=Bacillus amyloliquefaciens TaxID=1390 RepID=UPI0032DE487B
MNILSKLNEVTINNTNRIAETDSKFCENQYEQYVAAREALQHVLNHINSVHGGYLDVYKDIKPVEKRIGEIKEQFVYEVVSHFSRQYKITLDTKVINKKYDLYLTHNDIIAEIFEQMGGFNFKEKAVHELIEASKAQIYNFDKVSIKKASLSITDFVWWDSWDWDGLRISWNSKKESSLFTALSHFENGDVKMLDSLFNMYKEMEKGSKHYDIFNKYEFDCEKFKSIKIFKNGKITIEFKNQTLAQEFANTYLKK